jgi:hypothetical protein
MHPMRMTVSTGKTTSRRSDREVHPVAPGVGRIVCQSAEAIGSDIGRAFRPSWSSRWAWIAKAPLRLRRHVSS